MSAGSLHVQQEKTILIDDDKQQVGTAVERSAGNHNGELHQQAQVCPALQSVAVYANL